MGRLIGGILLVAGTSIGAGMLALPILTASAGFFPSLFLFVAVWLATLFTALLVLEANLWFKREVNLISMARFALGRKAEAVTWVLYLLLLYSLTAAYLAGSGATISYALTRQFQLKMPLFFEPLPLLILFAFFVYLGTKASDFLNRLCMVGLGICYVGLIFFLLPESDPNLLVRAEPSWLWAAVPVVVTSFGFHVIIPVLTTYLKQDVKALKKVIWIGSMIPLIVYLFWEYLTLTVLPSYSKEVLVTESLALFLNNPWITSFASLFAFFAILTSFLGVSLSLASFLSDGFGIKKTTQGKVAVTLLTFVPPLAFVFFFPRGFVMALEYAGGIVAFLSGILPALIVWRGRTLKREQTPYRVRGGRVALVSAIVGSLFVMALVIWG